MPLNMHNKDLNAYFMKCMHHKPNWVYSSFQLQNLRIISQLFRIYISVYKEFTKKCIHIITWLQKPWNRTLFILLHIHKT